MLRFAQSHESTALSSPNQGIASGPKHEAGKDDRPFRFFDNRQTYLMFVNTCNEKWMVAERIGRELKHLRPSPPALRVFDGGTGDGTILATVMRDLHRHYPNVPLQVVAKEISVEDVRLCLEKMADRLAEHPATVLTITNMFYDEAPLLRPRSVNTAAALNWQNIALEGSSAFEYDEQIKALAPLIADTWGVTSSPKSGNPLYVRPSVLTLYRKDQEFLLDGIIPHPGIFQGNYDLIIASQPYQARASAAFKARRVLAPLSRALGPAGRMAVVQSFGNDPGMEVVRKIWPDENPFQTDRHTLLAELKKHIPGGEREHIFDAGDDSTALFKYSMHNLPSTVGRNIGTSGLFAAWNAATYVAQIEQDRITDAMKEHDYLEDTQEVLIRHDGLWFWDEFFVITKRNALGDAIRSDGSLV